MHTWRSRALAGRPAAPPDHLGAGLCVRLVHHERMGVDRELEAGGCYCLGPDDLVHAVPPEALVKERHLLPQRQAPGLVAKAVLRLIGLRRRLPPADPYRPLFQSL